MKKLIAILTLGAAAGLSLQAASAATLDIVKQRGHLVCGANTGLAGFGISNDKGQWAGLDVDLCKAISAAIFNDADKVKYVPLSTKDQFTALQSGEIDVLIRNATWTISRDTSLGLNFTGVNYYDSQGFMVRKSLGVTSAKQLNGSSICVPGYSTSELNLADYIRSNNLKSEAVAFASADESWMAYDAGRCDAFTSDISGLYAARLKLASPDDHVVLPEIISKEPLGPSVRHGDNQWFDIVQWTHFAMLNAEELDVTQTNVDEMRNSPNPEIKRLLGGEGAFGEDMGLTKDWAYRIIKLIGNYGEVFERNVGSKSLLRIDRGLNALWTRGGLQYAPPFR